MIFRAQRHVKDEIKLSEHVRSIEEQFSASDGFWVERKGNREDSRLAKLSQAMVSSLDEFAQWRKHYS